MEHSVENKLLLSALGDGKQWDSVIGTNAVEILEGSELYSELHSIVDETMVINHTLNQQVPLQESIHETLSTLWGTPVDGTTYVQIPFHTDFGRHTVVGKHVFINKDVLFTDLGGITIEDHVLIGPRVSLITVNHCLAADKRRSLEVSHIRIKRNAWLGANVTVLPGVTIGEYAVVGANSVVTKDVPDNTVVVGSPAKVVKYI